MSFRPSNVGVPMSARRTAGVPRWYAPGDMRAVRAMSGLGATVSYPHPVRPGVWFAPGDVRAVRAVRAMSGLGAAARDVRGVPVWYSPSDLRAMRAAAAARTSRSGLKGLLGLLGLGTDVAPAATSPTGVVMTTDPNAYINQGAPAVAPTPATPAPGTVTTTITATIPTQMPDGSMSQRMPVTTLTTTTPKKWYSFLETTKPDGTVTGPLGMSWTVWIMGGGVAALFFASRNSGGGGGEQTPNRRRRKNTRRKTRRNRRRSR